MPIQTNGPRRVATLRRPITTSVFNGRRNLITAVNPINKNCGHARPIVRNVVEIDGPAAYICRECYTYLQRVEVRAVEVDRVRGQLAALFTNGWPLGITPGAAAASGLEVAR